MRVRLPFRCDTVRAPAAVDRATCRFVLRYFASGRLAYSCCQPRALRFVTLSVPICLRRRRGADCRFFVVREVPEQLLCSVVLRRVGRSISDRVCPRPYRRVPGRRKPDVDEVPGVAGTRP